MGTTLIFVGLEMCDGLRKLCVLIGLGMQPSRPGK